MPYGKITELPDAVQKLPAQKQRQFLAAFNSAHKKSGNEETAFKIAWAAVKESASDMGAAGRFRDLMEDFDLAEAMAGTEIDDANGILKNVVLLTSNKKSANNTFYTDEALAEAKDRYEGANMFLDHGVKGQNRSVRDFGGVYKNLHIDGNKLRGDVALRESARKDLTDIAKMRPAGLGLSIKDRGRGYDRDGVFYVQGFQPDARYSIDFVVDPSVNRDLFESTNKIDDEGGDDMDLKSLTLDVLSKDRPDLIESIQNAGKAAILKELEEAKATGGKSEALAAKMLMLVEADFSKEVLEGVKKMIMPEAIGVDAAKAIIAGQKELIEAIGKKNAGPAKDPKVTGLGPQKEADISEAADKDIPKEADILNAFGR